MRQRADRFHRVVLAGPNAAARLGMRLALEREGFEVVADVAGARDAVLAAGAMRPDACVVDLGLSGAVDAVRQITTRQAGSAVAVLSAQPDAPELVAAVRAGASCYLPRAIAPDDFVAALRDMLAGQARIPRHLLPSLVADTHEQPGQRRRRVEGRLRVKLTEREWAVMELLRDGASTEEVAARLEISAVTVRRHISDVMSKLKARDRGAALELLSQADG
jgi:DNA-binding NarL/FixJ family response regulator